MTRIRTLKLLAKAISISYPAKLVKTLSAHSDGLLDLSEDFEKTVIFIKHEIKICTYYETKTTFLLGPEEVRTPSVYVNQLKLLTPCFRLSPSQRPGCTTRTSGRRAYQQVTAKW